MIGVLHAAAFKRSYNIGLCDDSLKCTTGRTNQQHLLRIMPQQQPQRFEQVAGGGYAAGCAVTDFADRYLVPSFGFNAAQDPDRYDSHGAVAVINREDRMTMVRRYAMSEIMQRGVGLNRDHVTTHHLSYRNSHQAIEFQHF